MTENKDECYLYHICRMQDIGNLRQGYIGISNNPVKRWRKNNYQDNRHLQAALRKYNDIVRYVLFKDTKEFCLFVESYLRPEIGMGWNCAKGGGAPPTVMERQTVPENGNPFKPKYGKDNPKFQGYYITPEGIFETNFEAAKHHNVSLPTIRRRCKIGGPLRKAGGVEKSPSSTWELNGWYFVDKHNFKELNENS